jgi:hypothetical protein
VNEKAAEQWLDEQKKEAELSCSDEKETAEACNVAE